MPPPQAEQHKGSLRWSSAPLTNATCSAPNDLASSVKGAWNAAQSFTQSADRVENCGSGCSRKRMHHWLADSMEGGWVG